MNKLIHVPSLVSLLLLLYAFSAMGQSTDGSHKKDFGLQSGEVNKSLISFESVEWLDYRVFDADRTDLPSVLLIGDSISGQYFEGVTIASD